MRAYTWSSTGLTTGNGRGNSTREVLSSADEPHAAGAMVCIDLLLSIFLS